MSAGRLGLIVGSSALGIEPPRGEWAVVQRHGAGGYALPHLIDHAANLRALAGEGCDRVLAIGSVGGLKRELGPGTFVCPDDFIALDAAPSLFADERAHSVPGFDRRWRRRVVAAWSQAAGVAIRDGGVYWQARGPRLETVAEIRLIAAHADVIGMTVASECIVAGELGLAYAAVCVVDNYANGVGERELTMDELAAGRAANAEALVGALERVLPALSRSS